MYLNFYIAFLYTYFRSSRYGDELAWAAAWIHRANLVKGVPSSHLDEARIHYNAFGLGNVPWAFSWDEKMPGVQVGVSQNQFKLKDHLMIHSLVRPHSRKS